MWLRHSPRIKSRSKRSGRTGWRRLALLRRQLVDDRVERVARETARRRLFVNFHGAFKPTGMERTWPNVLTYEAVLNQEYNKWQPPGVKGTMRRMGRLGYFCACARARAVVPVLPVVDTTQHRRIRAESRLPETIPQNDDGG